MNDLDEILRKASNQMTQVWGQLTNQPAEMIAEAQKYQDEAIKEYHHEIMVARIQTFIFALILAYVFKRIWSWLRNTERHLKTIADAAQQKPIKPTDEANQTQNLPPVINIASRAPASSSENPDSRYMPKP